MIQLGSGGSSTATAASAAASASAGNGCSASHLPRAADCFYMTDPGPKQNPHALEQGPKWNLCAGARTALGNEGGTGYRLRAHLQMGQTARRWLSHWSMHSRWYRCLHGSTRSFSPSLPPSTLVLLRRNSSTARMHITYVTNTIIKQGSKDERPEIKRCEMCLPVLQHRG